MEIVGQLHVGEHTIPNNDAGSFIAKDNLDKLLSVDGSYSYATQAYYHIAGFRGEQTQSQIQQLVDEVVAFIHTGKEAENPVIFSNESTLRSG